MQSWIPFQREALAHLCGDFEEILSHTSMSDGEWAWWRGAYLERGVPQRASAPASPYGRRPPEAALGD